MIKSFAWIIFQLFCVCLATYFGILQVLDFVENADRSAFSLRSFNKETKDKYPTFSICIDGKAPMGLSANDHFYDADKINKFMGITTDEYLSTLLGTAGNVTNISMLDFDNVTKSLLNIVSYSHIRNKTFFAIDQWDPGYAKSDLSFHTSFQHPYRLCITRNYKHSPLQIILDEECRINIEHLDNMGHGHLEVFLHYPGQFIKKSDHNEVSISFPYDLEGANVFHFMIKQVQVLRKRHDAQDTCNQDMDSTDDMRWREVVMNYIGCIPLYWKKLTQSLQFKQQNLLECNSSKQYQNAFNLILEPTKIKYQGSCTMMTIMVNVEEYWKDNSSEIELHFKYATDVYEEVQNSKAFNIGDLCGQAGGIIGMFLGFSVLQLPSLLSFCVKMMMNIIKKIMNNGLVGDVRSKGFDAKSHYLVGENGNHQTISTILVGIITSFSMIIVL